MIKAQDAVYETACALITEELQMADSAEKVV